MKTKTILFVLLALVLTSITVFQSCNKKIVPVPDNEAVIPKTTKVISGETWQNTVSSVDTNNYTFVFNTNPGLETGDIMVSSNDGGYLRKVSSVTQDNGKVIVKTDFTSITDAIEQVQTEYETSLKIDNKKLSKAFLAKGVSIDRDKLKSSNNTNLNINIDFVIYDKDGDFSTTDDQVKLNGSFGIASTFKTKIKIQHFNLKELSFTYDISKQENLSTTCGLALITKEKTIAKIPFADIVIPAGIPITIQPVIELDAGVKLNVNSHLNMGVSENINYVTTVAYSEGNWTTQKELNKTFNYESPVLTNSLTATVYIKPKLLFKIYRTLSPKVEAELYGEIDATDRKIDWQLYAGFKAGVGVQMEIWKKSLFNYSLNLFDLKDILAQGTFGGDVPVSNFIANPTSGTAPLTVNFTDQSTNTPTSWRWDFGDGGSSTGQNPSHIYNNAGTYTVKLTATNNFGSNTKTQNGLIVVNGSGSAPVAGFTATPTTGTAPLTVNFTDQSSNTPTSWQWNFGDGGSSTEQNPVHIYQNTGNYTVKLTAKNQYGSNTLIRDDYINVTGSEILWQDNFNNDQLNEFPDEWLYSGNGNTSYVTNESYYSQPYSLAIQGISGGNWEGLVHRAYNNSYTHYQFVCIPEIS